MLKIEVPAIECFDETTMEFSTVPGATLLLEHSLVSISKWEAIWNKPFLSETNLTKEEFTSYISCMTINKNVNQEVYDTLPNPIFAKIREYMDKSMTATTVKHQKKGPNRDIITSELIYYWMISLNIPFECEKWHLSRLMTLIDVCDQMNNPKEKMSRKAVMSQNRELNNLRRKQLNSKG